MAREVVEAYADSAGRVMEHPVGTGPYRLHEWRRGQKIVLTANPNYHEEYFPTPPAGDFATTGDAMMRALYGPNAGANNLARFRNAEFDTLYQQSKRTRDDAERARVYERMARIVGARNPWGLRVYAIRTSLVRPVGAWTPAQPALPSGLAIPRRRLRRPEAILASLIRSCTPTTRPPVARLCS